MPLYKQYNKAVFYVFLLVVSSIQTVCAQRISDYEAKQLLENAQKTDGEAKYRVYKRSDAYGPIFKEDIRLYYLKESADLDYLPAILDLAQENRKQKKYKEEVKWLERGMQLGSGEAMCRLAQNYRKGEGVSQNIEQAKALLYRAIEINYLRAKADLRIIEGKSISPIEKFIENVQIKWYDFPKNSTFLNKVSYTFYRSLFPWFSLALEYFTVKWWVGILILISFIAVPAVFLYFNGIAVDMDETRSKYFQPMKSSLIFVVCGAVTGIMCIFTNPGNEFFSILSYFMGAVVIYGVVGILFFSTRVAAILIRLPFFLFFSIIGYFIGIEVSILIIISLVFLLFNLGGSRTVSKSNDSTTLYDPNDGTRHLTYEHGADTRRDENGDIWRNKGGNNWEKMKY